MKPVFALALVVLSLSLASCGRRGPLDTPVSYEQALPGTPEAQAAAHPPIGPDGKPVPVPVLDGPQPAARSFPLDPLLN